MLKCQHLPPPEGRLICPLPWGSLLSLNCIYPAKYHKSKFPFGYGETLPSHPSKHSVCFQVERHRFHLPSSSSSSRVCFQDSIPLLCSWRKRGIERERGSEFFVLDKVCSLLPFPTYLPTSSSRKMPGVCLLWRSSNQALEGKRHGKRTVWGGRNLLLASALTCSKKKKRVLSSSSSCQASLLLT